MEYSPVSFYYNVAQGSQKPLRQNLLFWNAISFVKNYFRIVQFYSQGIYDIFCRKQFSFSNHMGLIPSRTHMVLKIISCVIVAWGMFSNCLFVQVICIIWTILNHYCSHFLLSKLKYTVGYRYYSPWFYFKFHL